MQRKGLTPAQRRAAVVLGAALRHDGFAFAGGAALNAIGIIDRPTDDLDSFSASCSNFSVAFDKAISALRDAGFDVQEDRRHPTFCRLVVRSRGLRKHSFTVDLGQDDVRWGSQLTSIGPALTLKELAANKVLAAFGRHEPRDLADLARLTAVVPVEQMVADATD